MKKLIDFGVVNFDSGFNPDSYRFHVRAEVDLNITHTHTKDDIVHYTINIEISQRGKRVMYGNCFKTILEHSELKDNEKFLNLCKINDILKSNIHEEPVNPRLAIEAWARFVYSDDDVMENVKLPPSGPLLNTKMTAMVIELFNKL